MSSEELINILMVDDSPTNLVALESILHGPERNLVSVSSGDDALRYLLDNEVAVVLLDVYMPGIDGLETAALIRSREKYRNIPIIFLTADSTGGRHLSRGYSLGAVDYIVKPVEPDVLRSKVNVFVELFKKNREVEHQAELLKEKNLELESANLARLNMLINLGQELAAEHNPWKVLENFCRSARKIVEAQEAAVGVLNGDGKTLKYFFRCRETDEAMRGTEMPRVAERALKWLINQRRPVRLSESDELLVGSSDEDDHVRSFLGAPILSAAGVGGWVYLVNKLNGEEFSEADERLAATLATQVTIAYENALLYSDAQRHATELQLEVAERKQAEEERARLLVREQSARAEAEEANRTKDEFLATLSHELRTPLSAILGWSHLVRTGKLDETQLSRAFETIERNARSQSQLIDDLLDVSRIITGKLQIESRPTELSAVIEAAIDAVRPAAETKSIEFETDLASAGCLVPGDPNRLQQIFWNLFSNAVKFSPQGGQVNVSVKRCSPWVQVAVKDSGIGISPEFLPFIFDRFRQADGSTTRTHGGLGLGLAIVKHLVQLHRGTVEVVSDGKDRGSEFTVRLPLTTAQASDVQTQVTEESDGDGLPPGFSDILQGLRILVVDDEADSRELITAILSRCGSEVKCTESVKGAIKEFTSWKPDLLVSDIGMPNEDGYSLISQVRRLKSKKAREVPAVALTAYATVEDQTRALSSGFQLHVPKPIDPETLVRSLASAAGRKIVA
ncbi:MAG TPA: response regulator [Pyrinomonadaceae bacterium]|nr:response regulator [Pyrinomonadaceae bacterium]